MKKLSSLKQIKKLIAAMWLIHLIGLILITSFLLHGLGQFRAMILIVSLIILSGIAFHKVKQELSSYIESAAETEKELEQTGRQFQMACGFLGTSTDGLIACDEDWNITYVNQELRRHLKYLPENVMGMNFWTVCGYEKDALLHQALERVMQERIPVRLHVPSLAGEGWLRVGAFPAAEGICLALRDISKQRAAEAQLKHMDWQTNELLRLIELHPDCAFFRNQNREIQFWNTQCEAVYGWSKEEAIGGNVLELLTPKLARPYSEIQKTLLKDGRWEGEVVYHTRSGAEVIMKSCWIIYRDALGAPRGVLEINQDLTYQKKLMQELARMDRLHLMGHMAAQVSQEVRNPLTVVRGFLQVLGKKGECKAYQDYFSLMTEELDKATAILSEFIVMAKLKTSIRQIQNLNDILEAVEPLILAEALRVGKNVRFRGGKIPDLLLDAKEIAQLVMNLVRNGLESMPHFGTVTVKTYLAGKQVVLSVKDEGTGIQEPVLERLGMPFVSTKEDNEGIGLAICYSIAARHDAKIEVHTTAKGTVVLVRFPLPRGVIPLRPSRS